MSSARKWIDAFKLSMSCELMSSRASTSRIAQSAMSASASTAAKNAPHDDTTSGSGSAAHVEMAGPSGEAVAPPTLAGNTETFANLPGIVRSGADCFRELGTPDSPGTVV